MRSELLNQVFQAILMDCAILKLEEIFPSVIQSIENAQTDPNQKNFDQHIAGFFAPLREALSRSQTKEFSSHWKHLITETKINILLAENLDSKLENLLSRKINSGEFTDEAKLLFGQFQTCLSSVKVMVSNFDQLNIGNDVISGENCELSFVFPASKKSVDFKKFIEDLQSIHYHLGTFSEILGAGDEKFAVKRISSMNYSVVLDIDRELGVLVVSTLEPLRQVLEVINKKRALIEELSDLPEQILTDIRTWSGSLVDNSIQDVSTTLEPFLSPIREKDAGQGHEITKRLKRALRDIVAFWDEGYSIEVHVASLDGSLGANRVLSPEAMSLQTLFEKRQTTSTPGQGPLAEAVVQQDFREPSAADQATTMEEVSRQSVGRLRSAWRKAS